MFKKLFSRKTELTNEEKIVNSAMKRTVTTCVLCAVACCVILASFTWAWLGISEAGSVGDVEAADLQLYMVLKHEVDGVYETVGNWSESNLQPLTADSDVEFIGGVKYKLTLYMTGTASNGYCIISDVTPDYLVKDVYLTAPIEKGTPDNVKQPLTFIFTPAENCNLKFTVLWGAPDENDVIIKMDDENNSVKEYTYSIFDGFQYYVPPVETDPVETEDENGTIETDEDIENDEATEPGEGDEMIGEIE